MKRLIAFDLDGTLVDTIADLAAALNAGLRTVGQKEKTVEETKLLVGHSIPYMCEQALPEELRESLYQPVFDACCAYYLDHLADSSRPYCGIPEAVSDLRDAGYTLCVVTNKPQVFATKMVDLLFPEGTFSLVLGMREGLKKKPDREMLDAAMRQLGFPPSETIYVGDSEVDVAFARHAFVPCVACSWGFRLEEELRKMEPEVVIRFPRELVGAVEKMKNES